MVLFDMVIVANNGCRTADYEAAGTAVIEVNCDDGGVDADTEACAAGCKAEDVTARFASLSPVPQDAGNTTVDA